jgi:hypothetical protein
MTLNRMYLQYEANRYRTGAILVANTLWKFSFDVPNLSAHTVYVSYTLPYAFFYKRSIVLCQR